MRILVDVDNVLNNLAESVINVYNEDSGDNLKIEDIHNYYIENYVKESYKDTFHNYFHDKRVWSNVTVTPDCQKYLAKLIHDCDNEVLFATSTTPRNVPKKAAWLQRNFPFLNIEKSLIVTPSINEINKSIIKADILIDDSLTNLLGNDREYESICVDKPWNKNEAESKWKKFHRCTNWEEIYNKVLEIKRNGMTNDMCVLCKCKDCAIAYVNGGGEGCGDCYKCTKNNGSLFVDHCNCAYYPHKEY